MFPVPQWHGANEEALSAEAVPSRTEQRHHSRIFPTQCARLDTTINVTAPSLVDTANHVNEAR